MRSPVRAPDAGRRVLFKKTPVSLNKPDPNARSFK